MYAEMLDAKNLYLFHEGTQSRAYRMLGAHLMETEGRQGTRFSVWAPHAQDIWVVGEFNNWYGEGYGMTRVASSGIWELFVPNVGAGAYYKYAVRQSTGEVRIKSDPYAFSAELRPRTASRVTNLQGFPWSDADWQKNRQQQPVYEKPMNTYEVHIGSWRRRADDGFLSYRDTAHQLIDYVKEMGYTHIELMPVAEHPLDGSWGYQQTGYYAVTSRYGDPQDFMYLVNRAHENGIGVILDWVPGHFCKDDHGLARFDGEPIFEGANRLRAENPQWGTLNFDMDSPEVRSFLLSNAMFWFDVYHIDGLRVDAVANLLYLDFGREPGEWEPNRQGGREYIEAIEFLRQLNKEVFAQFPGALMIAEESSAWPGVTRPAHLGGLGFNYKWNMGWMNDMLRYVKLDPLFRKGSHNLVTFAMMYAYAENYVLPLSHDEVVHGKRSLLDKMPGDYWQQFAGLRGFLGFTAAHPGKKLTFMGAEFGQFIEWDEKRSLDWHLLDYDMHGKLHRYVKDLNQLYLGDACFWEQDHIRGGFRWINPDDSDTGIVSFIRYAKDAKDYLVFVCNFTPIGRTGYVIGVPDAGEYKEVLNSDSEIYGGSNACHELPIVTQEAGWNQWPHSIAIGVPPLGFVVLRHQRDS